MSEHRTTGVPFSDTVKGALGRRYARRNRLKVRGKRGGRHLSETAVGKRVIAAFMKPLIERLKGDIDPPGGLAETLKSLPPEDLAQAVLAPLLHGIFTVWRDERRGKKSSTARQNLSVAVGQYLHTLLVRQKLLTRGTDGIPARQRILANLPKKPRHHRRKKGDAPRKRGRKRNRDARNLTFDDWDRRDLAQVGDWLISQAMALPCFTYDRGRKPYLPAIAPQWMQPAWINRILAIKRYFIGLDALQLPDFKPIPPWTAPVRGNLHFVSTYRRDTHEAIAKAFAGEFDHARGVSALEGVRFKLDPIMVDLVEAMAGNQLGKTLAGGFEAAMHATGRYPQWWQGKRFDRPTIGWACGVTGEVVRDTVQRVLIGRPGQTGTGAIPKDAIAELVSARGIPDLLDSIKVNHVSGGQSIIGLKSYLSGREKFQGETLDWVWLDEEPPMDIYSEALTRTNIGAPVWMTFTPLLGMSEVVRRFLQERSDARHITSMTIDDVQHYSEEERATIIASYPPHELEARTKGIPTLGSGRIFPVPEHAIAIEQMDFPGHWPRIARSRNQVLISSAN